MRRCRIKLPNRCYHLISRVADLVLLDDALSPRLTIVGGKILMHS